MPYIIDCFPYNIVVSLHITGLLGGLLEDLGLVVDMCVDDRCILIPFLFAYFVTGVY